MPQPLSPDKTRTFFRIGVVIFIATLAIHALIFFTAFPKSYFESHGSDYTDYQLLADNLLSGNGLSLRKEAPYVPDTMRTPMYPIFLALIKRATGSFYPSLYLTLLLGATIPLAGVFLMRLLTEDTRLWWLTAIILAFDPNIFYYSFIYGSEGLGVPLFAWSIVFCAYALHWKTWYPAAMAGLMTGLATLTRPVLQLLPFLFVFIAFLKMSPSVEFKRQVRAISLACVAGFAAVVAPWLLRNYLVFGVLNYSSTFWFNMYTRAAGTAEAIHEGLDFPTMRLELMDRLWQKGYVHKRPVLEGDVSVFAFTPIFKKEAFEMIKRYPKEFVISQIGAFLTIVSQDNTVLILNASGHVHAPSPTFSPIIKLTQEGIGPTMAATKEFVFSPWIIAIIARIFFLMLFTLSCAAPFVAWRWERRLLAPVLFLCLYQLMVIILSMHIAAQASGRYRTQFIFSEVPLALYVFAALLKNQRRSLDQTS